ncbi:MogA/MoaB family molybdenum cofactor biosynthesis protein [Spirulina sp. CCNP1310]|uniref:MogA/MoaB family molybdenum cofactor biosynthesis protein n=1 Tax=Spirulina sp. CCNP1310 TaxID=3110249 RepID=UPI002B2029F2|nr:MogA/MoaB family molybdenum cofactor biosynthesis protein [Spirulina sp. CCNP1310]MEA5418948.1 MogA/MoaB family molybdenum cofactor biosynthesis protein [Spirulina sp. CCNP1310]
MHQPHPDNQPITARCGILTISDTRTPENDTSGQAIQDLLTAQGHKIAAYQLCPDDPDQIRAQVIAWGDEPEIDLVITNGGTGIAPRDCTVAAIAPLLTRNIPGFGELFRMLSFEQVGSRAMASQALGGMMGKILVFALPGSTKAVTLGLERLILPEISHLLTQLRGLPPAGQK